MGLSFKSRILPLVTAVALGALCLSSAAQAQDTAVTVRVGYFNLALLKATQKPGQNPNVQEDSVASRKSDESLTAAIRFVAEKYGLNLAVDGAAVYCGGNLIVENGVDITGAVQKYLESGAFHADNSAKPITARIVCFELDQLVTRDPVTAETAALRTQAEQQLLKDVKDSNAILREMEAQNKSKEEVAAKARTLQLEINAKQQALIQLLQSKQQINNTKVASAVADCAKRKQIDIVLDQTGVKFGLENLTGARVTKDILAIMQPNSFASSSSTPSSPTTATSSTTTNPPPNAEANDVIRDKWAVVIGITKFANPAYNLRYSAKDAIDFRNYLITDGKFRPDHVLCLVDEQATKINILKAIGSKWLPMLAEQGDLVVIYISTHGTPASSDNGGKNFIVAYDTDASDPYSTGVDMDELVRRIKEIQLDRAVIVLDTCFSGGGVPGARALSRYDSFDLSKMQIGRGQVVISASSPNERSWESRNAQNGVFTRHLIDNLRAGPAVDIRDAFAKSLSDTKWEVKRDYGVMQTPQMGGNWEGKPLILSLPASRPRPMGNSTFINFGPSVQKPVGAAKAPPPAVKKK